MNPCSRLCPSVDRLLPALLAALLLVRLATIPAAAFLVRYAPSWTWSNNDGYDTIALNWATTGTFGLAPGVPTAARLPLYPALIAACYRLAGDAFPLLVMAIQALLSTATGAALYSLAHRLFGRRPAIITLVLFILHPQVNNFIFRCATETLFTFLVVMVLHRAVRHLQTGSIRDLAEAAAWLGLSLLTRQTLAPLAGLAALLLLLGCALRPQRPRRLLARVVLPVVVTALIVAPWLARNYAHSDRFPVLQTWVGQPMCQGIYVSRHLPEILRGTRTITEIDQKGLSIIRNRTRYHVRQLPPETRPIAREVRADRFARQAAISELRQYPLISVGHTLRNLALAPVLQMTRRSTLVLVLWNGPLLLLSLAGLVLCARTQPRTFIQALPIVAVFCYIWVTHAVIWPQARYVLPGLVPFSLFAGLALAAFTRRREHQKEEKNRP